MAPVITRTRSLPASAQLTAKRLAAHGFPESTWGYVARHPLADLNRTMQPRNIGDAALKAKVNRLKIAMRPYGDNMDELLVPPVIFSGELEPWLLDGNHRTIAAYELEWEFFPAFVLSFSYEKQVPSILDQMRSLVTESNTSHGENYDRASLRFAIRQQIHPDSSHADLALRNGVSKSFVQSLVYGMKAETQAERLGLNYSAPHISDTHLANLGRAGYDDPVFTAFLELIITGKMTSSDERAMMKRLTAETTEAAKVALLERELVSRSQMSAGKATKPQPGARLRQLGGQFLNHDPGRFTENNPENFELHRITLDGMIRQLMLIREAQYKLEADLAANKR